MAENNEYDGDGADYFIKKDVNELLKKSSDIDTILLGCTHYPLLINKIKKYIPSEVQIISQGSIISASLENYLFRHPEMQSRCSRNAQIQFFTTDSADDFDRHSEIFFGQPVRSKHIELNC